MNEEKEKRPFFSIIIPCYNTKVERIQSLFFSIEKQNMNNDIEIIVVNDRSTDSSFLEKIKTFTNLNIIIVDTPDEKDFIHCPGNSREIGANAATGEQLTFIDHDDELIPDTFNQIKENILEKNLQYIVSCDFYEINPYNDEILNEFKHTGNWMHGKFYNLDNFQKAKNFHFKKNLQTHEDIYISSKTMCELQRLGLESPYYIDIFCLKQKAQNDSTSRQKYNQRGFLETFFNDYCVSTIGYYIDDYVYSINELKDYSEENLYNHLRLCIDVLMHMYFYIQSFHFQRPKDYILENDILAKKYIRIVYELFNTDANFIYACVLDNDGIQYNNVRNSSKVGAGTFVESDTFYNFLK